MIAYKRGHGSSARSSLGLLANSKCGRTNYATSRSTEPCQPWICEHGFGDLACYSGTSGNQSSWYWKEDVIYVFICKICKYVIVLFMYPVFSAFAWIYENVPQPSLGYDAIYMQVCTIWLGNSPGFLPEALLGGARPWIFASPYQTLNFGMTGKQIDRLAAAVSKGTFLVARKISAWCVCLSQFGQSPFERTSVDLEQDWNLTSCNICDATNKTQAMCPPIVCRKTYWNRWNIVLQMNFQW